MKTYLAQSTEQPRLSGVMLLGGLGGLALLLAVIGIYGVVVLGGPADAGNRRPHGARGTRRDVLGMVARQAIALIGAGLVIGVGAALALGSVMQNMLFEVPPGSCDIDRHRGGACRGGNGGELRPRAARHPRGSDRRTARRVGRLQSRRPYREQG